MAELRGDMSQEQIGRLERRILEAEVRPTHVLPNVHID